MKAPAFQFYPDDFMGGTADMTQSEVGAYILLLCRQWNSLSIPEDPERLKLVAKGPVTDHVLAKFPEGRNPRLELVRSQREEWVQKSKNGGKQSAEVRWGKGGVTTLITTPITKPQPKGQPNCNTPTPTPTPITTTKLPEGTPTKAPSKLLEHEWQLANRIEAHMNGQWVNDAGKWISRIRTGYDKTMRVWNEVESAVKESRITTTPAQYSEQIWKEFK